MGKKTRKNNGGGKVLTPVSYEEARRAQVLLDKKFGRAPWMRGTAIVVDVERGHILELRVDPSIGGKSLPLRVKGTVVPDHILKVKVRLVHREVAVAQEVS